MTSCDVYENTPENAEKIGWGQESVSEYVFGDATLPFVIHDWAEGTFTYAAAADIPEAE